MVACLNGVQEAESSNLSTQTKTGPIIDAMCQLSVRFFLSGKALKSGAFYGMAGASGISVIPKTPDFRCEKLAPAFGMKSKRFKISYIGYSSILIN